MSHDWSEGGKECTNVYSVFGHPQLSQQLDVSPPLLATAGDRAFNVAAARLWNSLPADITAAQTLAEFRRRLKTLLFSLSFPIGFDANSLSSVSRINRL